MGLLTSIKNCLITAKLTILTDKINFLIRALLINHSIFLHITFRLIISCNKDLFYSKGIIAMRK